jgi:LPPG:FO 2-phospho-L-lactate transferase
MSGKVIALSGGVGGAKLALGLQAALDADDLTIVVNTADDFEHLGLPICPDLDTMMYTLSGVSNQTQGWGLRDESWRVMEGLETLSGSTWFRLGDLDLATHLRRRELLDQGLSLTQVTAVLCRAFGVMPRVLPMSDQRVRTFVDSERGQLTFQDYFVRQQCQPLVTGFTFKGINDAAPQKEWLSQLADSDLRAVIICPSNPYVSVGPILKLPGVIGALKDCDAPVIAVTPIVSGMAIKGPAAKMMTELGMASTVENVFTYYRSEFGDILDGVVIDYRDADSVSALSMDYAVITADTVMHNNADKLRLAKEVLDFSNMLWGMT